MLSNSRKLVNLAKATPEQIVLNDVYGLRSLRNATLVDVSVRNKISWQHAGPYNKRWQYKWKHAYYTYPRDYYEHDKVRKPEDSKAATPLLHNWIQDVVLRWLPGLQCWWDRRHRMYDNFSLYVLPGTSALMYQFWDVTMGFKVLSFKLAQS